MRPYIAKSSNIFKNRLSHFRGSKCVTFDCSAADNMMLLGTMNIVPSDLSVCCVPITFIQHCLCSAYVKLYLGQTGPYYVLAATGSGFGCEKTSGIL